MKLEPWLTTLAISCAGGAAISCAGEPFASGDVGDPGGVQGQPFAGSSGSATAGASGQGVSGSAGASGTAGGAGLAGDSGKAGNSQAGSSGSGGSKPDASLDSDTGDTHDAPADKPEVGQDAPPDGGLSEAPGQPCVEPNALGCHGSAGKTVLVCDPVSKTWAVAPPCPGLQLCDTAPGPTHGTCLDPVPACVGQKPGAIVCEGDKRHTCGPDLVTSSVKTCGSPQLCQLGSGPECAVCLDGQHQCDGETLRMCAGDHMSFVVKTSCAAGTHCNAGAGACTSTVCAPDQHRCTSDAVLEKCNAAQEGFDKVAQCQPELCDAAGKQCDVCVAGTTSCRDGSTSQTCSADGQQLHASPCVGTTPHCVGLGVCVECRGDSDCQAAADPCKKAVCTGNVCGTTPGPKGASCNGGQGYCNGAGACGECLEGARRCSGVVAQTCTAQGAWDAGTPCPFACLSGSCGGVCKPGAAQCSASTPQTCDATGQWVSGQPCNGSACVNGACTGSCTPGAKQCSGQVVQTCNASGQWQGTSPCSGSACVAGACVGGCEPGQTRCDGATPQSCDATGHWNSASACPFVCSAGACTGVCTPGAKMCSGTTPMTCSASGQWSPGAPCPYACSAGSCTGVCVPGDTRCNGPTPQTCNASGQWDSAAACPFVCSAGSCSGVCVPGTRQCSGAVPQTCNAAGQWQSGAACPYVCTAGICGGECVPGAKQCNGSVPQTCSASGQWQSGTACPYVCSAGTCTGSCTPGAKQCSGTTPQTCSASGQWQSGAPCPYVCSAGTCTGVCVPGAKQCNGLVPQTCSAAGQWDSGAACPYLCTAGNCTGVCTPGARRCDGMVPQTCNASAQWDSAAACTYQCLTGVCQDCPPGYYGPTCQDKCSECNGTCTPGLNGACVCAAGWRQPPKCDLGVPETFESYPVPPGAVPPGWTLAWSDGGQIVESGIEVFSGDKALFLASTKDPYYQVALKAPGVSEKNVEVLFLVRGDKSFDFALRGQGDAHLTHKAYHVAGNAASTVVAKGVNYGAPGAWFVLETKTCPTNNASTQYWVRFRVQDSSVQAKLWDVGENEPFGWCLDASDFEISGPGWIGASTLGSSRTRIGKVVWARNGEAAAF